MRCPRNYPVSLVFAWVDRASDQIRTILGQMNFFHHYRIIFEAYNDTFEIIFEAYNDTFEIIQRETN